ncbi:MAG: branched-chain amino acid ABC transporter permease [Phascolarctobacterium sp.]|nr:branched-chain amino acid ABC transporter permease [Phascolarctobacterium sp.]
MTGAVLTQQFFNALSLGVMYALIAVGFTLFFGVIEVVNFAHGEVFMLGAFAAMIASGVFVSCGLTQGSLLFILLILAVVIIIGALFGAVLEKYIVSPMRDAPDIMTLLITLGASIVVREAVMLFVPDGRNPQTFPVLVEMDTIHFGGALVKPETLLCIVLSIIMIAGMHRFIQNTTYGRYIRATAQDRGAAMMMGIDVKKIFIFTLIIGSILGSVAGLMNGMTYNIIKFNMGFAASIKGFAAAVVGGLGNIYGAIIGGLLLGFMEIFTVSFITDGSSYQDMISFIIVIICLVFRPAGLFGEKAYEKV